VEFLFHPSRHYERKFDEAKETFETTVGTILDLMKYSPAELKSTLADYDRHGEEFWLIQTAIEWQARKH
jgi:hypothetical protein